MRIIIFFLLSFLSVFAAATTHQNHQYSAIAPATNVSRNICTKPIDKNVALSNNPGGLFVPLGSANPPIGIFLNLLHSDYTCMDFSNWNFAKNLIAFIRRIDPDLPINIVLNNHCAWLVKPRFQDKNINFIGVPGELELWQQDYYEFGYDQAGNLAILELPKEESYKYSDAISRYCGFTRFTIIHPRGISNHDGNLGGNVEAFPGDVLAVGTNM